MPAILVALALLAISAVPAEVGVALRSVVIRGTVSDATTAAPLMNAVVTLTAPGSPPLEVSTGNDGAYTMRVSLPDTATSVTIRVRRIGYRPTAVTAAVIASIRGDTVTVNVSLVQQMLQLQEIVVTGIGANAPRAAAPFSVSGSAAANGKVVLRGAQTYGYAARDAMNTEEYSRIEDNRFLSVASSPLSTFSVDVDRASYTNVRRYITSGTLPPKDAVRIEELVNYFPYSYREPTGKDPVSITTDVASAPWNPTHRVVRIGLQTQRIRTEKLPPSNLVFLLDVSGSMTPPNKLPLVKQAFRLLVNELREQDRVAIVVYAGNAGLVLPSTPASEKEKILDAIERLEAGGSTAGGAGIKLAYDVAQQNFMKDGNNRVILATDGDFNVGVSSTSELERLVEARRAEGTYLTVLGFGMGNYKDNRLETLADKGNGNYAYIDDLLEARKVFVHEFGATLVTVAKDVKLQIEFNPEMVQAYRLIGYENRMLRNEDFTDDKKDAGDMGAGHSVTALYDVIPVGVKLDVVVGTTDSMRYQRAPRVTSHSASKELLFVNVRYKPPKDSVSRLLQQPVFDAKGGVHPDFRFALAVAGYGMLLRDSQYKGGLSYDDVIAIARESNEDDRYRNDFITLVESTKRIARGVAVSKPD